MLKIQSSLTILPVLKEVKNAQGQHGLKHGDYQRYRAYCTRRIKRLRKSLDFTQIVSRHKQVFKQKKATPALIVEAPKNKDPLRYLHVSLMYAERCWAFAMALKQESNTEHRKKFHLVRKLRKAVMYANDLLSLCNDEDVQCDTRTKLEAQAYCSYIFGLYFFETDKWRKASDSLQKAQTIYVKLCEAIKDPEVLQMYQQRVDEIKPTLRFCAFNLGEQSGQDILDNLGERGDDDYLAATLDQLILQAQEKEGKGATEIDWLGKQLVVKTAKVRTFLLKYEGSKSKILNTDQVEKLLWDCRDAIQELRNTNQDKSLLGCYLTYLRNEITCERNLTLVRDSQNQNERIRLYEIISGSLDDTKSLLIDYKQQFNEEDIHLLISKIDAKLLAYKAFRCYSIGSAGRVSARQSIALLHRASEYAAQGLESDFLDDVSVVYL